MTDPNGTRSVDTVVLGASQAGLAVGYHLSQQRREYVVLERDSIGCTWQKKRWDSFTLVTPNWMNQLPGFAYAGDDPDGFLDRSEVVKYLQDYARSFGAPVETGVAALRVTRSGEDAFLVETTAGRIRARNVVVATGYFTRERIPDFAARVPPSIVQIASGEYRNPAALPPGAVLVVGSGQTGCQLAEELQDAGRKVYLCVGNAGRQPRRYRGKDVMWWLSEAGIYTQTFKDPANPVERGQTNPMCSGKNRGHALNLEKFVEEGMTLLGHAVGIRGSTLQLAPGVREAVAKADQFSKMMMKMIDAFIAAKGIDAPPPDASNTDDGTPAGSVTIDEVTELDLAANGVGTIIWSTGFNCDYSWVEFPVYDERGYPVQTRGVTAVPGLYFCGLHWLHCLRSGLIFGVGEDARHIVENLSKRP